MNSLKTSTTSGYRRVNSPLPALPPPPKFKTLPPNKCYPGAPPKPPLNRTAPTDVESNLHRAASIDINLASKSDNSGELLLGYETPIKGMLH